VKPEITLSVDGIRMEIAFANGEEVILRAVIEPLDRFQSQPMPIARRLLKAIREAKRDIAYSRYGKDWPEHCSAGDFWSDEISDDEAETMIQVFEMLGLPEDMPCKPDAESALPGDK